MVYTVINNSGSDEDASSSNAKPAKAGSGFWNLELELQAIKTMLTPSSEWATKVYSACKPEFFHHSTTKTIFARLQVLMGGSKSFELPTLDYVLSDSKITPSIRQTLREAFDGSDGDPVAIVQCQGDYDLLLQGLAALAKTRAIYNATHKAANELLDSNDPTEFVKQMAESLGQSLFNIEDEDDDIVHLKMGVGYNQAAEDSYNRILNGVFDEKRLRTGFKEFDERTGGFHRTNLVIIAGGSGSGKSLLAVNLLVRQFLLGYKVVLASYEMSDDEVMIRLLACISEVDMNKIQNKQLTPQETTRVTAAWREFNLKGFERGSSYDIFCPKKEQSVPEVGFRIRNLKPDSLILDYINLLASSSGDDKAQWQQLGDIAKEAKLLANKLNCVVTVLAQLDDTYQLRYSKGIKDHANFVWGFVRDEAAVVNRVIDIKQIKARNAPLYQFQLNERFDIAQFRDPEQTDRTDWPTDDDLLMLEIKCQAAGLKFEPTASKEFDKKKQLETKQFVNNVEEPESEKGEKDAVVAPNNLLFSAEDAIPKDFSKLTVKGSSVSLLRDRVEYGDDII